jgi:hypothetical protein
METSSRGDRAPTKSHGILSKEKTTSSSSSRVLEKAPLNSTRRGRRVAKSSHTIPRNDMMAERSHLDIWLLPATLWEPRGKSQVANFELTEVLNEA